MRSLLMWSVVIFAIGCANNGQLGPTGPISISQFSGVSAEEQQKLIEAIEELNTSAGQTLVSVEAKQDFFPITITKVDPDTSNPTKVGFATLTQKQCDIELSAELFTTRKSFFKSVLWHELGHCFGLVHEPDSHKIMSAIANSFATYSPESIQSFVTQLLSLAGYES